MFIKSAKGEIVNADLIKHVYVFQSGGAGREVTAYLGETCHVVLHCCNNAYESQKYIDNLLEVLNKGDKNVCHKS